MIGCSIYVTTYSIDSVGGLWTPKKLTSWAVLTILEFEVLTLQGGRGEIPVVRGPRSVPQTHAAVNPPGQYHVKVIWNRSYEFGLIQLGRASGFLSFCEFIFRCVVELRGSPLESTLIWV
jgi:hypothetical protein